MTNLEVTKVSITGLDAEAELVNKETGEQIKITIPRSVINQYKAQQQRIKTRNDISGM
ncbi:MAG: hypothetical protein E6767_09420 [Dysgonomonas sp.]|nr:hypothetical protein [Dysgonomonas sp.]